MRIKEEAYAENDLSNTMRGCSIVCAILVILIHSYNIGVYDNISNSVIYWFEEVLSQCLARAAVPFFFIQSSFFLYSKEKTILEVYRSRFCSVAIPYLLWNTIYMILFGILTRLSLSNVGMQEVTVGNILEGIFLYKYNYTYWFMQYLIIYILLYPVIRWIISRSKGIAVLGMLLLLVLYWGAQINQLETLVYYYIGAVVGFYCEEKIENIALITKKQKVGIACGLFLIGILLFWVTNVHNINLILLRNLVIVLWIFLVVSSLNIQIWGKLVGLSFMIYAMHPFILEVVEKLIYLFLPHNVVCMIVDYLIAPIIALGIVYAVCMVLRKTWPWAYKWLNGGRI